MKKSAIAIVLLFFVFEAKSGGLFSCMCASQQNPDDAIEEMQQLLFEQVQPIRRQRLTLSQDDFFKMLTEQQGLSPEMQDVLDYLQALRTFLQIRPNRDTAERQE